MNLTEMEITIIKSYRRLNQLGKSALTDFLAFLLQLDKYLDNPEDK